MTSSLAGKSVVVDPEALPVSYGMMASAYKKLWTSLGLTVDIKSFLGTHCVRIASATCAVQDPAVSYLDLKWAGHWSSDSCPAMYVRKSENALNKVPEALGRSMGKLTSS